MIDQITRIVERDSRTWVSIISGSIIHKVRGEAASRVASLLRENSMRYRVPLAYFLAVVRQESAFDPEAVNPNRNRYALSFEHTDWGLAQISGTNLVSIFPTLDNIARAKMALDPAISIPFMAHTYRGLLDWSKATFPRQDPLQVATLAYNKGRRGASEILAKTADRAKQDAGWRHVRSVMRFYRQYRAELRLL